MFIRRKKLIKLLKEKQKLIREENQYCKEKCRNEKKYELAKCMQYYEDGNDNAFNYIISILEKSNGNFN